MEKDTDINTYNKYKSQNFELIAVSMFYDPPSHVLSYSKKNNLPFPVVLDIEKKIAFTTILIKIKHYLQSILS